jgi:hypothetical protein
MNKERTEKPKADKKKIAEVMKSRKTTIKSQKIVKK